MHKFIPLLLVFLLPFTRLHLKFISKGTCKKWFATGFEIQHSILQYHHPYRFNAYPIKSM